MIFKTTFCLLFVCSTSISIAQQVINKDDKAFSNAKELYDSKLLLSARKAFESYINIFPKGNKTADAKYYIASSAVKLSQDDGEALMQKFVLAYPYNTNASGAYLDLARHFFQNEKYDKVSQYYEVARENQAEITQEDLFQFGYAYFIQKQFDEAQFELEKLTSTEAQITKNAAYFLGYIAYQSEKLPEAKGYLQKAFDSEAYKVEAIKLYVSILYTSSQYQELIYLLDKDLITVMDADIIKMQADSYFELKSYRLASMTYAELFGKSSRFRTHQSYYRAGVSNLQIREIEKSIDNLKRAALSKDTLGAYASYQLGILYANNDNLVFASSSFDNVTRFETELKTEASYLQAKTEFDLKNYDKAISLFHDYLKENPNTEHTILVNEMLSEAYLNTKNYDRAIEYIESLSSLSYYTKSAYQRVTFLKGISLYNASRYKYSIGFLKKSLTYTTDDKLEAEAYFYIGEAYSRAGKYKDSKFYYEQAIESNIDIVHFQSIYGLGYAYFNLKSYGEAFSTFQTFDNQYIARSHEKYYKDVLIRMGDCSYVLKNYADATLYYDKALANGSTPVSYIQFQKGLVYRYAADLKSAKTSFNIVINDFPKSEKADDALFQLGQMEFEKGNYKSTIQLTQNLILNHPESKFLVFALLNEAVAQNNIGNQSASIKNYRTILDRFPRHPTANSALLGLQELAGAGLFKDFDSYLTIYKNANPKSEALENIEFETAQSLFYNQNYDKAIEGFVKFKNDYSESALHTEATYFIADSWFRKKEGSKALENYYQIADKHDYSKYRKIQQRIATLEANNGNLEISNIYYMRLKISDGNFKDMNNANFGLMSNHYVLSNYDSAVYYGDALMVGSRVSNEMTSNAYLILGKAAYYNNNFDEASDWFLLLINDSPDERGAEAKYFMSEILYEKQDYKNSLQSLFELKDEYRMFGYWVGKAFLLMADNYMATDEVFQAKATLISLIENIEIESIKTKAQEKLSEIEAQEKLLKSDTTSIENK